MKITQLKNGKYTAVISLGSDWDGKRIQKRITEDTPWEVQKAADELLSGKIDINTRNITVREAMELYIDSRSCIIEPTTLRGYHELCRNRLVLIHNIMIKDLRISDVQRAVNQEASQGLSQRTIKNGVALLKSALEFHDIFLNFKKLQLPREKAKKNDALPEIKSIFQAVKGTGIEVYCALAFCGCMRIGELLGLKFSDIDFQNCKVYIHRTQIQTENGVTYRDYCKTPQSIRTVLISPQLCAQIQCLPHQSMDDYIVPMSRKALYSRYARIMKHHGLPTSFHLIRKMSASALHAAGMADKYIMYLGGWSTDNVLKSVYQKTFESEREAANQQAVACFSKLSAQIQEPNNSKN